MTTHHVIDLDAAAVPVPQMPPSTTVPAGSIAAVGAGAVDTAAGADQQSTISLCAPSQISPPPNDHGSHYYTHLRWQSRGCRRAEWHRCGPCVGNNMEGAACRTEGEVHDLVRDVYTCLMSIFLRHFPFAKRNAFTFEFLNLICNAISCTVARHPPLPTCTATSCCSRLCQPDQQECSVCFEHFVCQFFFD